MPSREQLPDRVTLSTCIGCGAMGGAARCDGECSEHRLELVDAVDFAALRESGNAARATVSRLADVVRRLADTPSTEDDCVRAYRELVDAAARVLGGLAPQDRTDRGTPIVRTGWWCAACGNVDAPEPCLGICVWRAREWVNADLYAVERDRTAADRRSADALAKLVRSVVAVTPRPGRYLENWRALQGHLP